MIEHQLLKEVIPLFFVLLYLFSRYVKLDLYYWTYTIILTVLIILFPFLEIRGVIFNSWRVWISYFQYLAFCWLILMISFYRTGKINYSFTLAILLTSVSGYLHEIPRYLRVGGLALFRVNRFSPFIFEIQILLLFLVPLFFRGINVDLKTILAGINYLLYCWIYYYYFDVTIAFRRASVLWIWIPHIVMFRLPIMIFFLFLVNTINANKGSNLIKRGICWVVDWILDERTENYPGFEETGISEDDWSALPFRSKEIIWESIKENEKLFNSGTDTVILDQE